MSLVARHDGMEIMGTEVAPDAFDFSGEFEDFDVAAMRISGTYSDWQNGEAVTLHLPYLPAKAEIDRLKQDPIHPDIRFHYRIIAAALAMRAAALMDDNTEEMADAINTAGNWVKDRDEKVADRYYDVIEKRCPQTKIGKEVLSKHWFVDETGPWSSALQAAEDSLHKTLGIEDQE